MTERHVATVQWCSRAMSSRPNAGDGLPSCTPTGKAVKKRLRELHRAASWRCGHRQPSKSWRWLATGSLAGHGPGSDRRHCTVDRPDSLASLRCTAISLECPAIKGLAVFTLTRRRLHSAQPPFDLRWARLDCFDMADSDVLLVGIGTMVGGLTCRLSLGRGEDVRG